MENKLYDKINYHSGIEYIISRYIREYDISKANISILYSLNMIDRELYEYLYSADRIERQIKIGLLQQNDKNITIALQGGIRDAKKQFFDLNNIRVEELLQIKNDAVFLIDRVAKTTQFGIVEFINKNTYTSYYKIPYNSIELYYAIDTVNNIEILDVRGIKKSNVEKHTNHFLEFLKVLLCSAETESIESTIDILVTFYNNYLNLKLDVNYYREFNSDSLIKMKKMSSIYSYKADFLPENSKDCIDISYNLNILRYFHKIYSGILFSRKRKR